MTQLQASSSPAVPARRHLLAVWNPVLASDAMEQHIRVLQDAVLIESALQ
jgi:hypothetical protein